MRHRAAVTDLYGNSTAVSPPLVALKESQPLSSAVSTRYHRAWEVSTTYQVDPLQAENAPGLRERTGEQESRVTLQP